MQPAIASRGSDAAGAATYWAYDALDRLVSISHPGDPSLNTVYVYDEPSGGFGVGRLTGILDSAGVARRSYDERGNLTGETRMRTGMSWTLAGLSQTTAYAYDAAGRVSA